MKCGRVRSLATKQRWSLSSHTSLVGMLWDLLSHQVMSSLLAVWSWRFLCDGCSGCGCGTFFVHYIASEENDTSFQRGETVWEYLATGPSKLSEVGWSNMISVTRLCIATIGTGTFKTNAKDIGKRKVLLPMQKILSCWCFFRWTIC